MRILEFSPFYDENELVKVKMKESSSWVDKLFLTESSYDFKCNPKGFVYNGSGGRFVEHVKLDGEKNFIKEYLGLSRTFPFIRKKSGAWINEKTQRNYAALQLEINDDDILIFSDIDEIIDSAQSDEIISFVKKHQIATVKLSFRMFYANVESTNWHEVWPGSPQDYAYRVFIMTGKMYKKHSGNIDKLRHLGESSKLNSTVACYPFLAGHHYSWLGGTEAVFKKIQSYAHDLSDHGSELVEAEENGKLKQYLFEKISNGQSFFPGHELKFLDPKSCSMFYGMREIVQSNKDLSLKNED